MKKEGCKAHHWNDVFTFCPQIYLWKKRRQTVLPKITEAFIQNLQCQKLARIVSWKIYVQRYCIDQAFWYCLVIKKVWCKTLPSPPIVYGIQTNTERDDWMIWIGLKCWGTLLKSLYYLWWTTFHRWHSKFFPSTFFHLLLFSFTSGIHVPQASHIQCLPLNGITDNRSSRLL